MLISYTLEYNARRDFFLTHLLKQEQEKVTAINQELEQKVAERTRELTDANVSLTEANKIITLASEKYRLLVEGSTDIIFTLDEDFNFLSSNTAIFSYLRVDPESLKRLNFLDLVYNEVFDDINRVSVAKRSVQEKLGMFAREKEPIEFITELASAASLEPKEMRVSMQYINIEGKNEIIGKASSVIEDNLIKYFKFEHKRFAIDNNLFTADELSHQLTKNLRRYMRQKDINILRIALREVIVNAIEHGNLNLTFDEKFQAIRSDNYLGLILKLKRDPLNIDKKVDIEYKIDNTRAFFKITDQGPGFDYNKVLDLDINELNRQMRPHGRGLFMAKQVFDEMQFNEKGNEVVLIKNFT